MRGKQLALAGPRYFVCELAVGCWRLTAIVCTEGRHGADSFVEMMLSSGGGRSGRWLAWELDYGGRLKIAKHNARLELVILGELLPSEVGVVVLCTR